MKKEQVFMALLLFVVLVVSRLVPHPQNFTSLTAVALFSGSLWRSSTIKFAVPLAAIFLTDMYIGFYPGALFNYAAVALSVLLAPKILASVWRILGSGLAAAVVFFVLSNFGVWFAAALYTPDTAGLVECYVRAIPFFQNQLLSTWFYSFVLYGTYRLAFADEGFKGFVKSKYG